SAIGGPRTAAAADAASFAGAGAGRRVLLVDHEDSFVHTLAGYIRQTRAECVTMRPDFAPARLRQGASPALRLLSPGPGRPDDFAMRETLDIILERGLPAFGVCLGLQGIVEYFGGTLDVLDVPMHGKPSLVRALPSRLFADLPPRFTVGRYHSLYARRNSL